MGGIETPDHGVPRLETDPATGLQWVALVVEVEFNGNRVPTFSALEPTLDQIAEVHQASDHGGTLQELSDDTERVYALLLRRGIQESEHPWLGTFPELGRQVFHLANLKGLLPWHSIKQDRNARARRVRNYG